MLNIHLYSQISIIVTMLVPELLLLKGERSDSKTKLKALFFSYRKPRFWIHKLEFECKLQIFPLFISVFKISITVTLFLAITVQLVLME